MNLHSDIMNLPCSYESACAEYEMTYDAYKFGHRDARHAAAELALQADGRIEELKRKCSSYASLVKAKEGQLAHCQNELHELAEARSTLASEREANTLLSDEIEYVTNALKDMLSIFQWMNDNPMCHPNNMRAAAKKILEKYS